MTHEANHEAHVVIVGGGITGIISAYFLNQAGKKVIIVEKDEIGSGATKYTTAFITQVLDTDFSKLISIFGEEAARIIIRSHKSAIDLIERIISEERIECDFMRCSNHIFASTPRELEELMREYESGKRLGLDLKYLEGNSLGLSEAGALEVKGQVKFNASVFVRELAKRISERGVDIFEHTKASTVSSQGSRVVIEMPAARIEADWAIIATYEPFNRPLGLYFKKAFYTTYVLEAELPKHALKEATYEDMRDPYHYFRVDSGKDVDRIVIGGEDHRSDIPVSESKNFKALEEYLAKLLPHISPKIVSRWKGPILEPVDGLAFIGPLNDPRVLYAMAFSGNGMTYSAISSLIFRDYILGNKNSWMNIYRADRTPTLRALLIKGKDYVSEFIHGALKNSLKRR